MVNTLAHSYSKREKYRGLGIRCLRKQAGAWFNMKEEATVGSSSQSVNS